jgi:hypothetical protein
MEEEEFAFQPLLRSKLPTAMPEWASPDVRSSLMLTPRSTIITQQSIWRVDPSLGPADVVVADGGADGVGFKALEEIQPGRSRGGTICHSESGYPGLPNNHPIGTIRHAAALGRDGR